MQNCRHFSKISGDGANGFDLIRSPMYKYNKEVKEKFFKDDIMAFLWAFYRISNSPQDVIDGQNEEDHGTDSVPDASRGRNPKHASEDQASIPGIMDEFDRLAWATLSKEANLPLVRFILENDTRYINMMGQPINAIGFDEAETPGQPGPVIEPIF